jgi:hypothetical protein
MDSRGLLFMRGQWISPNVRRLPTKFEMIVNLKTAKALRLRFPHRFCCALTRMVE